MVVVGVHQVIAPAAVAVVTARAADKPVVAEVAEDLVVAVGALLDGGGRGRIDGTFVRIEAEQELAERGAIEDWNALQRVVLVVKRELDSPVGKVEVQSD